MAEKPSPLARAAPIINTLWVPAALLYFIEHVGLSRSLGAPFAWYRFIDPVISLVAEVIFLAWIWGLITETLTGESLVARLQNFKLNLKKGWWIVLLTLLAPQAMHFLIFIINRQENLSLDFLKSFLYTLTAYLAAGAFFKAKYKHLTTRKINDIFWSNHLLLYGIFFLSSSLALHLITTQAANLPILRRFLELITIQAHFLTFATFTLIFIDTYPEILKNFQSPQTLILINPPAGSIRVETFSPVMVRRYPPFFSVLKALTPPGYRVIEYNRVTWRNHFYQKDALVAITCFTTNCASAYHIAREFRRRGSKVIMGGPHVTFFPQEALEFCDSVVIGAAESVWETVIHDYENNNLQRLYHGHVTEKEAARAHQFLLGTTAEVINDCLEISPGCKFNCYFCAATALSDKNRQKRSVAEVMPLIKKIADRKMPITFIDNNIYADPAHAKELFQAMIPLKTWWAASASINIAQDNETLRLLKESRCCQLLIGYEIDADSAMQKKEGKFALAKDYVPLTRKLQKANILIQGQFIFGFPGDSWASLVRLWWFCFRLSPAYTIVSFLTPLPGSRFFEESIREEKLLNLNWRSYDLMRQVVETPRLKSSWILQNAFTPISLLLLFTTSFAGRILIALVVIMEIIYYHIGK